MENSSFAVFNVLYDVTLLRMLSLCQYPPEMMTLFTAHVMTAPGLILHLNKSSPEVRMNLFFKENKINHYSPDIHDQV